MLKKAFIRFQAPVFYSAVVCSTSFYSDCARASLCGHVMPCYSSFRFSGRRFGLFGNFLTSVFIIVNFLNIIWRYISPSIGRFHKHYKYVLNAWNLRFIWGFKNLYAIKSSAFIANSKFWSRNSTFTLVRMIQDIFIFKKKEIN